MYKHWPEQTISVRQGILKKIDARIEYYIWHLMGKETYFHSQKKKNVSATEQEAWGSEAVVLAPVVWVIHIPCDDLVRHLSRQTGAAYLLIYDSMN